MQWCRKCVLPDTRPNAEIGDDGICCACKNHAERTDIDWSARAAEFRRLVDRVKGLKRDYDCVIPVSGGKDSTWQVVTCLEHGLRPLAVSWRSPVRNDLGAANLQNLIDLSVDHIDFRINPGIESAFNRKTFEKAGSPAIPMHMAIFAIPLSFAVRYEAPLVVWGENSAVEYGSGDEGGSLTRMNEAWLERYGATQGTNITDWSDDSLPLEKLAAYRPPDPETLANSGIEAIFLGHYFPWDPETSFKIAAANGFKARAEGAKTGYYDYADIDDEFISIHHWLKWYKFGFTRLFDNLSLEIRNGRMTRSKAITILMSAGAEAPDRDISKFCDYTGLSTRQFFEICERFRNTDIWRKEAGIWMIDDFLCADWNWQ